MEESLCRIEITREDDRFIGRMHSALGGNREYSSMAFDRMLNQIVSELQDEFDLEG